MFSPAILGANPKAKVIITIYTTNIRNEIEDTLERMGYVRHRDFFSVFEAESIFSFYRENRILVHQVSLILTDVCNLSCEKCVEMLPFIHRRGHKSLQYIKEQLEHLFSVVDYVKNFLVIGGEPFLYPSLSEILQYIRKFYGERIGRVELLSNGTIIPSVDILRVLHACDVFVSLSSHENSKEFHKKQYIAEIIELLRENRIEYDVRQQDTWFDFSGNGKGTPETTFRNCPGWGGKLFLEDGRFHICCIDLAMDYGKIAEYDNYDFLTLQEAKSNRALLLEYMLGYSHRGYPRMCGKHCLGDIPMMSRVIPAARQT